MTTISNISMNCATASSINPYTAMSTKTNYTITVTLQLLYRLAKQLDNKRRTEKGK